MRRCPGETRPRSERGRTSPHRPPPPDDLPRGVRDRLNVVLEGQVTVDGAVVNDAGHDLSRSGALRWDRDLRIERRVATSLKVLYEDDDAIAVVKPSGLLDAPDGGEGDRHAAQPGLDLRAEAARREAASGRSSPWCTGSTRRRPASSFSRAAGAA